MSHKTPHYIALLTPVGLGMHGQVMNGIMSSAEVKDDQFRVFHFFSRGLSEDAIRDKVEQILSGPFVAIVTIGVSCAYVTRKVLAEKQSKIVHIFVGATDPFKTGLGENAQDLIDHNMTGILYDPYDNEKATRFLLESKPKMERVLVATENVGNSGTHLDTLWIDREVSAIRQVLEPKGIQVHTHTAQSVAYLYGFVRDNIKKFDTLILLEGGLSISIFEPLGGLCDEYHRTLFSGLLEPVHKSAAIGYGASYESMGAAAMELARKLLIEELPISQVPLVHQSNIRVPIVNLALAPGQDLDPDHIEAVCKKWDGIILNEPTLF